MSGSESCDPLQAGPVPRSGRRQAAGRGPLSSLVSQAAQACSYSWNPLEGTVSRPGELGWDLGIPE